MSRTYVNELADGQGVDQVFLASEKQLRPNRAGNLYLQLRISDRTGSMTAMLWNANQRHYDGFENGDFVRVQGTSQLYNGGMQVIAKEISRVMQKDVDEQDFITLSTANVEQLSARLGELLRSVRNVHLRNLGECFLVDEEFMARFKKAPAGVKNHHAYHGGLIDHVVSLMELSEIVAQRYPRLDPDIMIFGAFLHDIGKIDELTYERDLGYSDAGQLLGHMVMGVELLQAKINEAEKLADEPFPEEVAMKLKHIIMSHHGEHQYGSPVLPMTLEAIALHFIDNLDAKMHNIASLIDEDVNTDSSWTTYHPSISRKIFKG